MAAAGGYFAVREVKYLGAGNSFALDETLRRYRKQSLRRLWKLVPLHKTFARNIKTGTES